MLADCSNGWSVCTRVHLSNTLAVALYQKLLRPAPARCAPPASFLVNQEPAPKDLADGAGRHNPKLKA